MGLRSPVLFAAPVCVALVALAVGGGACAEGASIGDPATDIEDPEGGTGDGVSVPAGPEDGPDPSNPSQAHGSDAGKPGDGGKVGDGGTPEGGVQPANPACNVAMAAATFDFESGGQGWTTQISDGVTVPPASPWPYNPWSHGTATAPACPSGKCVGAELTQKYAQCTRGHIQSPKIDLDACKTTSIVLRFRHAFAFWHEGTSAFDGGIVEISGNGGTSWQVPAGTYPGTVKIKGSAGAFSATCTESNNFHVSGKKGFVGDQREPEDFEITVPPTLVSNNMRVRFSMAAGVSLDSTDVNRAREKTDFGWRIDDVRFAVK